MSKDELAHSQAKRSQEHQPATEGRKRRFRKHWLEQWLYHALSDEWVGNDTMPLGGHVALHYNDDGAEYVVSFEDDAHELGFGYPDEWKLFITRKNFHKVMRWYLWKWATRDLFGLKRYIWYKLLHRMVTRQTKQVERLASEPQTEARTSSNTQQPSNKEQSITNKTGSGE